MSALSRAQMSARGTPGDRDEPGIDVVLIGVFADPCDRTLDVDERVRERGQGTQPVVDVEADPSPSGEPAHEEPALVVLEPDHPTAAVHLHQRGPADTGLRCDIGRAHVESELPTAGARERDVPVDADGKRIGVGFVALEVSQRFADLVAGRDALTDGLREPDPRRERQGEPDAARPAAQSAAGSEQPGGEHLPREMERCELDGDPRTAKKLQKNNRRLLRLGRNTLTV